MEKVQGRGCNLAGIRQDSVQTPASAAPKRPPGWAADGKACASLLPAVALLMQEAEQQLKAVAAQAAELVEMRSAVDGALHAAENA